MVPLFFSQLNRSIGFDFSNLCFTAVCILHMHVPCPFGLFVRQTTIPPSPPFPHPHKWFSFHSKSISILDWYRFWEHNFYTCILILSSWPIRRAKFHFENRNWENRHSTIRQIRYVICYMYSLQFWIEAK